MHVDVIGPHVQDGHYDLVGPNGEIILPAVWENTVQPGWQITMRMWPMDNTPPERELPAQGTQMLNGVPPPPPTRQMFHPFGMSEVVDLGLAGKEDEGQKVMKTRLTRMFSTRPEAKPTKKSS